MESWAEALRKEGIATDVIFMSTMFSKGDSLVDLRAGAAKYGADALLVLKGAAVTDSYMNPAALFNVTVVGGFVVPGSHRDALFVIEGGLVDVNNGFLYASMEAEGEGKTLAPTFIIEEKDAIERAKQQALTAFGPEQHPHFPALDDVVIADEVIVVSMADRDAVARATVNAIFLGQAEFHTPAEKHADVVAFDVIAPDRRPL